MTDPTLWLIIGAVFLAAVIVSAVLSVVNLARAVAPEDLTDDHTATDRTKP